jgi:eukaryotic-like serine/threonine-protein kinase
MRGPSQPSPGPSAGEGPLVGRVRELQQLIRAFEDARASRGGVHLILGEPGVGKTRLAAALADHAAANGASVIWARGWGRAAPAYWPWVEVVRSLCADLDGAELRRQLGASADELLRLAPELAERLPAAQAPQDGDLGAESSEIARFTLFDALVSLLRTRSAKAPVVVIMDDLQAVDEGSLVALDFVSRMLRDAAVLLVVTMHERVPERSPDEQIALANIARAGRRLVLGGLAPPDIAALIETASGSEPGEGLVHTVHTVTEGNPFFAREIVALLLAEGHLADAPDDLPLPEGVRETIRRRLEPLALPAVKTLELAAILGRTFQLATLEQASTLDRDSVLAALDEAAGLGLVVEVPGTIGQYRFGHGLIRETLLANLPASARMASHQAAGEALEHVYRGAIESHLPELAHHFLQAAPRGDLAKAVEYAERAAQGALDNLGYEQAAELFSRGLEAQELLEPDPQRRAQLLLGLAAAQSRAGRPVARATYETAVGVARAIGDDEILARAALGIAPFALTPGFVDDGHVKLLTEALDRLGPADDPLRVRLLGSLAVALYWSDAAPRRRELAGEALAMAERLGDDLTMAFAACTAQLATTGPDSTVQGLQWLETLFAGTLTGGESTMTLAARSRHIDLLLELDDLAGADMAIETLDRVAAEARDPRAAAFVPLQRARRAALEDRFEEAHALVDGVAKIAEGLRGSTIPITVASQRVVLTWIQRGPSEIGEQVRAWADAVPAMPVWRAGLAAALVNEGRVAEAQLEFDRLAADGFAGLPRDNLWFLAIAMLAEVAGPLEDRERARELHAMLAPFSGRNVVLPTAAFLGPVDMWLGVLARIAGDREEALTRLAAARIAAQRHRSRTALVRIAVEEATLLAQDPSPEARERAVELLDGAQADCEEIDLPWLRERVLEVREQMRAPRPAPRPASVAIAPASAASVTATLRRDGDVWTITHEERTLHLNHGRGVRLLALLLERPGVEIHCLDLVAAVDGSEPPSVTLGDGGGQVAGRRGLQGGAGPALDAQAKSEYRARVDALGVEIAEAEAAGDDERAGRARVELEFISRELARAVGIGGRDRQTGAHAERARVNVTRAVRTTLKRIAGYDARLGRALEETVQTGTFCAYRPNPRRPVIWQVEDGGTRPTR